MKKLAFFFVKNQNRRFSSKFVVILLSLLFTINQTALFSTANKPEFADNKLNVNYTPEKFIDYTLGKAFTLSDFTDIIGTVVEFDSQNNGFYSGYVFINRDGDTNLLLGKLDNFGNQLWEIQWANLDQNEPIDMIFDEHTDRLYITGVTFNSSSFYKEIFLACFNPEDGSEYWNITLSEINNSFIPNSMAITEDYIFVTGIITPFWHLNTKHDIFIHCFHKSNGWLNWSKIDNSVDFNTQPSLVVNEKLSDIFLVYNKKTGPSNKPIYQYRIQKLDYSGNVITEIAEQADEYIKINDIILHNESDSLILAGDFWESTDNGYKNSMILRYDFALSQQFQLVIGESNENEVILDIVFDSLNNLIVTGYSDSDFKATTVGLIGKYSWSGSELWISKIELFYACVVKDIAIDNDNNLLLTGHGQYYSDFIFNRLFVGYTIDSDNDLLSDIFELDIGTNPLNPDSDGDGYSDGREYLAGTDPLNAAINPGTIKFWNYFALSFTIVIIILFVIVNLFVYFTLDKSNENNQSAIIKLTNKISIRKKKQNDSEKNEQS
ncbi:MAG: thrombospondin type 3 repeat-containing protein [Candidatus Heimdallarchaeota archaeon]